MRLHWLATVGVAAALSLSACSGGGQQATQSSSSASSGASTQAQATATTAPATPTTAPTVAPTVAPSPTTAATPTAAKVSNATPTAKAQAAPSGPDVGQGDIQKMAEAWAAAKTYRIVIDSTDPNSAGTFTWEVVRPDREHMKMSIAGKNYEVIKIGQTTYTFFNDKWIKSTATATRTATIGANPDDTMKNIDASVKDGTKITKGSLDAVGGAPCQQWVITGKDDTSSGTMCIGLLNNLPLQFKAASGKWTMTFKDWNAPISIEPPNM